MTLLRRLLCRHDGEVTYTRLVPRATGRHVEGRCEACGKRQIASHPIGKYPLQLAAGST